MDVNNITEEINKLFKDAPGVDTVTATIKAVSPTTVINFLDKDNQENPHHIIGCALLINGFGDYADFTFNDKNYKVPSIADMEKVKFNSLIYIKDHQKLEVLNIIDGALMLLYNNNVITKEIAYKIIDGILNINSFNVLTKPFPNINLFCENELHNIADNPANNYKPVINNLFDIVRYIWFIPYGKLDEIYDNFVAEYNNSTTKK